MTCSCLTSDLLCDEPKWVILVLFCGALILIIELDGIGLEQRVINYSCACRQAFHLFVCTCAESRMLIALLSSFITGFIFLASSFPSLVNGVFLKWYEPSCWATAYQYYYTVLTLRDGPVRGSVATPFLWSIRNQKCQCQSQPFSWYPELSWVT